ncbi:MAG TPA: phosphoribosylamine--glycine ligase [Patescibacteria group bacterium]
MGKTIAVIDAGGRGAALVAAYAKSIHVDKILAIPGNDYMQENSSKPVITYPHLKTTSVTEIVEICKKENVFFVDVAQDNAVAAGLVDALEQHGIKTVGPTKSAGELEWSKAYSREFMKKYAIAQPEYAIFYSVLEGEKYLASQKDQPWFVKASGLAEGKGALPAKNNKEAKERIYELQKFGDAGKTYLLEKWLRSSDGSNAEEFSAFAISDGNSWQLLGFAQDHKRVNDNDEGENTGGMGVSTPPLVITEDIQKQTIDIFEKTFQGLQKEKRKYKGILYLGGILVEGKVYIIEYNARWGDPECEVILPGILNDFYEVSMAVIQATIDEVKITTDKKARVAVAGAAKGYPVDYSRVKGKEIIGLDIAKQLPGITIFGAGIKKQDNKYVVNGGRVFYVVGEGNTVLEARENAYKAIKHISIEGDNLHFRTDIGWRDVNRVS